MFAEPPPPPRRAPPFFGSFGFAFLFGGGFFTLGLLGTAVVFLTDRPFWDDTTLDARGVRVDGTALDVRSGHASVKRSASQPRPREVMEIQVRFADRRGGRHTAWVSTINDAVIAKGRAHGSVTIEYDPADPSCARVLGEPASVLGLAMLAPVVAALVGVGPFLVGLWGIWRARRIDARGRAP